jgi:hypothetical protein
MSLETITEERKLMPSNYPEIDWGERWKTEFNELMATGLYNRTEALNKIGEKHNCSRHTIYRGIFPESKIRMKKNPSRKWAYESTQPQFSRPKFNEQRALKEKVRYNIEKYISLAFRMSGYQSMELPQLSDLINEMTNVRFKPSSFLTLNNNYQKQTGQQLIERYKCHAFPQYGIYLPKK